MELARQHIGRYLVAMVFLGFVGISWGATELPNLAIKKTATASASEDGNPPENAVDGDADTRWCNSDAGAEAWWQVDLEKPQALGGLDILWEHDGSIYKYIVEGSADGKTWTTLNDQRGSKENTQDQKLTLAGDPVRYLRIRTTELEDGSWASFFEVKLYDAASMKKLPDEQAKAFHASAPVAAAATGPATGPAVK